MGTRLAVSGYIGLAVYCLVSLFWGTMGIQAYSELESRVRRMEGNLRSLETLHQDAQSRLDSVRSDPATLALEARSLGYVADGEVVVHAGFPEDAADTQDLGTLVPYVAPRGVEDAKLKAIAVAAALCSFFASLLVGNGGTLPAGGKTVGNVRRPAAGRDVRNAQAVSR